MTKTGWRVWLVLMILVVALPVVAQVTDCTGESDSTACVDTDNNPCTLAACDEEDCNQNFGSAPAGTTCPDTDGDLICSFPGCNGAGLCDQTHTMAMPGTACPDTDNDICSIPSCNPVGNCNQSRSRMPDGTECPDTDGLPNTHAACESGGCNQLFAVDSSAPALSAVAVACLTTILLAVGFWQLRRRSQR